MSKDAVLFSIHPTCEICGKELVKVKSGLLCMEGHGPIVPLDEFIDRSKVPVEHKHLERMKQTATGNMCAQFSKAQRALDRLDAKKAKAEAAEGGDV